MISSKITPLLASGYTNAHVRCKFQKKKERKKRKKSRRKNLGKKKIKEGRFFYVEVTITEVVFPFYGLRFRY